MQIVYTLCNISSFLGVFPSDLLQPSITSNGTIIINTDSHPESGSYRLAIHFQPKSHSAYYFDSYGQFPFVPDSKAFLRRNCTFWDYNTRQL